LFRVSSFLVVLCLAASPARAATYHVSQEGHDANSCAAAQSTSPSSQKLTIAAGVACLVAGDTLLIHAGTYTGRGDVIDTELFTVRSGTSFSNAITVAARSASSDSRLETSEVTRSVLRPIRSISSADAST